MFKRGGRLFHNDTEAEVENESEEKGKQETGGGSENSGDRDVEARRITRLVSGSTLAHAELTEQLKPKSEKKKKKGGGGGGGGSAENITVTRRFDSSAIHMASSCSGQ
ncbi:hypothetical protein INR49_022934 [Caranx melampygus]|nr:hypothetical protein INR49_022934 [Caranx melampygus]